MTSSYNKCGKLLPVLFFIFVFLFSCASPTNNTTNLKSIRDYLKTINKPGVKTIKSPDGDLIDCVLFHLQPAFDHPMLQGHKAMMDLPQIKKGDKVNHTLEESSHVLGMSEKSCPENTVPIRRITEEDVLRAGSVEALTGLKPEPRYSAVGSASGAYYGVDASFTVWKPFVIKGERSISMMRIMLDANNYMETGYMVGYPDAEPRLFAYWTASRRGDKTEGCYNTECGGFVQTSGNTRLGAALHPPSKYGTNQIYHIRLRVQKFQNSWMLRYQDELIGFWPDKLFDGNLQNKPTQKLWFGGEVVSNADRTWTQMGSGHLPGGNMYKTTALIGHISVTEGKGYKKINGLEPYITIRRCYDANIFPTNLETYMYYGGPGCH